MSTLLIAPPVTEAIPYTIQNWFEHPECRLGELVAGHLRLKSVLGMGGYAVTYSATDERMINSNTVVVKMLYIRPAEDPVDKLRRFVIESCTLDVLGEHAQIVAQFKLEKHLPFNRPEQITLAEATRLRHAVLHNQQDYFIVLQYMPGGNLWDRLRRRGKIAEKEAIRIILGIGAALCHAHRHGVLHRDVTPGNVLFDSAGRPRLADWGLAHFIDHRKPQARTIPSNRPIGTPGYIPRESFDGQDTVARDVYALGITLIEMITGPIQFPSDSTEYNDCYALVQRALRLIPSRELRIIAQKAVAEESVNRYVSVEEMLKDLRKYQNSILRKTVPKKTKGAKSFSKTLYECVYNFKMASIVIKSWYLGSKRRS